MIQSELGKKVLELRRSKGFTQEELAQKCKLSVRTLQRIESGEAIPRYFTVKSIFVALEHTIPDNLNFTNDIPLDFSSLEISSSHIRSKTTKNKTLIIWLSIFTGVTLIVIFVFHNALANRNGSKLSPALRENREMVFSYFSCGGCMSDKNELIGRDVEFKINGVKLKVKLIRINQTTWEFDALLLKGHIFFDKVEINCFKDVIKAGAIKFSGNRVTKQPGKILLSGNATVETNQDEFINASEIILNIQ